MLTRAVSVLFLRKRITGAGGWKEVRPAIQGPASPLCRKKAFGVKGGGFFFSWVRQDHLDMDLRIICLEVRIFFLSRTIMWNAL